MSSTINGTEANMSSVKNPEVTLYFPQSKIFFRAHLELPHYVSNVILSLTSLGLCSLAAQPHCFFFLKHYMPSPTSRLCSALPSAWNTVFYLQAFALPSHPLSETLTFTIQFNNIISPSHLPRTPNQTCFTMLFVFLLACISL